MSIKQFPEILKELIEREKKLLDFYDLIQEAFRRQSSREIMKVLFEKQSQNVSELKSLKKDHFQNTEFVKNPPELLEGTLIQETQVNGSSSPLEILTHILEYETKLLSHYERILEVLAYEKAKDLIEEMICFKKAQIKEIAALAEDLDLSLKF